MKAIALMKGNHIVKGDFNITKKHAVFISDGTMIKSFNDIKDFDHYKNFSKHKDILSLNLNIKETKEFLKNIGVKDLWFYDFPPNFPNIKEFNHYWMEYYNVLCLKCKNNCKQSSHVKIIKCKNYKGK